MQFTAFVIFFLALIAKICSAVLTIETFELDESLVDASIEILESCYKDRLGTVGIAGPSAGSIMKGISSRETVISTTLIEDTSRSVDHDPIDDASRYKLQVFVVTVSDLNNLAETLGQVQNSTWWNHMASFLLIDSAKAGNGCSNAYGMLWEAWKMNLLNSKVLCLHQTRGRLIYTFNPYTSQAPSTWQQKETYKGMMINGQVSHVWTLFVREYDKDESRCDGLDFDKPVDLGGYPINAFYMRLDGNVARVPEQICNITAELLINALNATWIVESFQLSDMVASDPRAAEIIAAAENAIARGVSDIFLFPLPIWYPAFPGTSTYPIYREEISILTHYEGHKSQLDKLFSVLDKSSRFAVLAVLTITLLFFIFCLRQPLIPAIMNLVLLVSNAAIRGIPQKTAPRIYLASLFVLVVTIQGIYSGKLASLLTKNVRLPTVDSLEDLARTDHTITVSYIWVPIINQPAFQGRDFEELESGPYKYRDPKRALVYPKSMLIYKAQMYSSHLSREPAGHDFLNYAIREDWPLQDKVDEVFGRLVASGVLDLLHARQFQSELRSLKSYELQDREPELKPLTLEHLAFAFKILAFGLGCATMVFIVEVATKDWD